MNECSILKMITDVIETLDVFFKKIADGVFMELVCRKNVDIEIEHYHKILWKLGSDMEASARLGAIMGDGSPEQIEILNEYGKCLGYISRLAWDVSDTLNLRGDLINRLQYESVPLPILFAAKDSRKNYDTINSVLKNSSLTTFDIKELLGLCFDVEAFAYIENIANTVAERGTRNIRRLDANKARGILELMIRNMVENCRVSYQKGTGSPSIIDDRQRL
jgi:geranylgeranyl pyrophosphate synthase